MDSPATPAVPPFRLYHWGKPAMALGLAVNHLMTKPAFAKLRFGEWSRVLTGQINRGHYCFAMSADNRIVGFAGWGLTTHEKAEAWVQGLSILTNAERTRCSSGAATPAGHRCPRG